MKSEFSKSCCQGVLESAAQVAAALAKQAVAVRNKIASLSETLDAIEKLEAEVLQMETMNWKKYVDIVVNLQIKNEFYGIIR